MNTSTCNAYKGVKCAQISKYKSSSWCCYYDLMNNMLSAKKDYNITVKWLHIWLHVCHSPLKKSTIWEKKVFIFIFMYFCFN